MSYDDWRRYQSCERKRAWPSELLARNYATLQLWKGGDATRPYRCDYCGQWHLTSKPPADTPAGKGAA